MFHRVSLSGQCEESETAKQIATILDFHVPGSFFCLSASGVTGGGQEDRVPLETFHWEIFADVSGKKRQGKKKKG